MYVRGLYPCVSPFIGKNAIWWLWWTELWDVGEGDGKGFSISTHGQMPMLGSLNRLCYGWPCCAWSGLALYRDHSFLMFVCLFYKTLIQIIFQKKRKTHQISTMLIINMGLNALYWYWRIITSFLPDWWPKVILHIQDVAGLEFCKVVEHWSAGGHWRHWGQRTDIRHWWCWGHQGYRSNWRHRGCKRQRGNWSAQAESEAESAKSPMLEWGLVPIYHSTNLPRSKEQHQH